MFKSTLAKRCLFSMLCLYGCQSLTYGQGANETRLNSPYSRYGLGNIYSLSYLPNMGMGGGMAATYSSLYDVNLQNPASLGKLRKTSLEVAGYYSSAILTESTPTIYQKATSNDGNMSYLSIAFPITHSWLKERDTTRKFAPIQWGMALSVQPHSQTGYDVAITRTIPTIGDVNYNYIGQGNRFRLNWGNGFRYKNLSVGFNLGWLLGKTTDKNRVTFQDSAYTFAYHEELIKTQSVSGLLWDLGIQYEKHFTNNNKPKGNRKITDWVLKVGAYGNSGNQATTYNTDLFRRYGTYYSSDTVIYNTETKGTLRMPAQMGAGVSFGLEYRWQVGINYDYQMWSKAEDTKRALNMANSYKIAIGGEWTPNIENRDNYFKRMTFRAGGFYGTDPRLIVGSSADAAPLQLRKYGITFGFKLPIETRIKSAMSDTRILSFGAANFAFEYGYLGHPDLIRERYYQVTVGFTVNDDGWFTRSKYR